MCLKNTDFCTIMQSLQWMMFFSILRYKKIIVYNNVALCTYHWSRWALGCCMKNRKNTINLFNNIIIIIMVHVKVVIIKMTFIYFKYISIRVMYESKRVHEWSIVTSSLVKWPRFSNWNMEQKKGTLTVKCHASTGSPNRSHKNKQVYLVFPWPYPWISWNYYCHHQEVCVV